MFLNRHNRQLQKEVVSFKCRNCQITLHGQIIRERQISGLGPITISNKVIYFVKCLECEMEHETRDIEDFDTEKFQTNPRKYPIDNHITGVHAPFSQKVFVILSAIALICASISYFVFWNSYGYTVLASLLCLMLAGSVNEHQLYSVWRQKSEFIGVLIFINLIISILYSLARYLLF